MCIRCPNVLQVYWPLRRLTPLYELYPPHNVNIEKIVHSLRPAVPGDIRCKGNETYGDYDFIPIYNSRLTGYDGRTNKIQGLYVSGAMISLPAPTPMQASFPNRRRHGGEGS